MESIKLLTNFSSNIILFLSFTAFVLFVFGNHKSKIHELPWYKVIGLKIGLTAVTCATLLNALTLSNPAWSEVAHNFGLSILVSWTAVFFYYNFVIPLEAECLKPKLVHHKKKAVAKKVAAKKSKTSLNKK